MIEAVCPNCGKKHNLRETYAGQQKTCACGAEVQIPCLPEGTSFAARESRAKKTVCDSAASIPVKPTAQCPYCSDEIPAGANKCWHCGEWLPSTVEDLVPQYPVIPVDLQVARSLAIFASQPA